jgi:hypothetical protein
VAERARREARRRGRGFIGMSRRWRMEDER